MGRAILREAREDTVEIPVAPNLSLQGTLCVPPGARGLVIFVHGSGSSRFSPRNQFVARALQQAGLGTLLMDLLTREEEAIDDSTGHLRFDVELLAARVRAATEWIAAQPERGQLRLGYFGASTGAAAALVAAWQSPLVEAVVSRGGRADLVAEVLPAVRVPTLLVVGERDVGVVELNRHALERLGSTEKKLCLIPGATHLFPEPGALAEVSRLAADWFERHLTR